MWNYYKNKYYNMVDAIEAQYPQVAKENSRVQHLINRHKDIERELDEIMTRLEDGHDVD